MHIFSNSGIADKNISYSKIPEAFTGNIFFTDLTGSFINGWQYEDGKITRKSNKQINAANPAGKVLPPEESCQTVETLWFERDCIEYYNGNYECGAWHFTYSTYHTYCTPPVGGGGGGGGGYVSQEAYNEDAIEYYPCENSFNFVKVGTNATWQAAVVTNYHMILTNQATRGRGEFTLNIGSIEIGMPYKTYEGNLIHSQNAKQMASLAGALAEMGVMNVMAINIRNNPALTPGNIDYGYYKTMFKEAYKSALDDLLRRKYYNGQNVSPSTVAYSGFTITDPSLHRPYDYSQDGCL
jgi:hypothetical protein